MLPSLAALTPGRIPRNRSAGWKSSSRAAGTIHPTNVIPKQQQDQARDPWAEAAAVEPPQPLVQLWQVEALMMLMECMFSR